MSLIVVQVLEDHPSSRVLLTDPVVVNDGHGKTYRCHSADAAVTWVAESTTTCVTRTTKTQYFVALRPVPVIVTTVPPPVPMGQPWSQSRPKAA